MVCRHKRSDVHAIYTLIAANQAELPVASMCDCLQISKNGFYDWYSRAPSKRTTANVTLLAQIEAAHALSDATYGMPRIRGVSRSYVVTTTRDKRQRPAPDLVKRQFVATDVNQLWVADMTYVPTWAGFLYLAVVTEVYSRQVVGWAFGVHMTADLVIAAPEHGVADTQAAIGDSPLRPRQPA